MRTMENKNMNHNGGYNRTENNSASNMTKAPKKGGFINKDRAIGAAFGAAATLVIGAAVIGCKKLFGKKTVEEQVVEDPQPQEEQKA